MKLILKHSFYGDYKCDEITTISRKFYLRCWNFSRGILSALLDILWETIKVNHKEKKNETQFVDEITKNLVTT